MTPLGVTRRRRRDRRGRPGRARRRVPRRRGRVGGRQETDAGSRRPALLARHDGPAGRRCATSSTIRPSRTRSSGFAAVQHRGHRRAGRAPARLPVALHRVAYLLYPPRAAGPQRRAVVGRSAGFIRYVGGDAPRARRVRGHSPRARPAGARRRRDRRRPARWPHQGRPGDGGRAAPGRRRPAGAARRADPDRAGGRHRRDRRRDGRQRRRRARSDRVPAQCRARGHVPHCARRNLLVDQGLEQLDHRLEDPPNWPSSWPGSRRPRRSSRRARQGDHSRAAPGGLRDNLRADLGFHAAVERLWPRAHPQRSPSSTGHRAAQRGQRQALRPSGWRATGARSGRSRTRCSTSCELLRRTPAGHAGPAAPDRYASEVLSILESADRELAGEPRRLRPPTSSPRTCSPPGTWPGPPARYWPTRDRRPGLALRPPRRRRGQG
ncbi:hypothetical protein HBB16_07105 [Pseudonocardia sp. MCCB 268]|nr:hypothetical protein [Pseudonocardia cytotoxica]